MLEVEKQQALGMFISTSEVSPASGLKFSVALGSYPLQPWSCGSHRQERILQASTAPGLVRPQTLVQAE